MTAKEFVKSPISLEITIIIVTFIMGMTLLVMAILFVIRLIALAILVMFSPIGFVGYIFPETSEFASKWWKNLFSYAFFGPIMIFMLKVSVSILTAMSDNYTKIISASEMNALDNSQASAIASIAFYPIPIILLWAGMGIAKSMGIAGAETVVNKAQGWGKAIGMRVSGMKFAQDTFRAYQARREQAKGDKASARLGNWLGNKQDFLRGKIPAPLGVGEYGKEHATARYLSADSAKIADETKLHDTANMDETGLRNLATAGNKFAQAAARLELANRGLADGRDLNEMRKLFEGVGRKGEDSQAYKQMQNKMKTYDPVAAFKGDMGKVESFVKSDQFDFKKVGKDSLRNDKFMEIIMDNDKADMKDINNIKDKDKKDAAKSSLITLAKRRNNLSDKKDAKIHAASFSQSGEMVDYSFAEKIFETMDGDSGKKMSITSLNNILAAKPHCLSAINPGKLKEIIASNNNPGVSEAIIQNIINNRAVNRGMEILAKQIEKDPLMRPLIPKKVLP